MGGKETAKRPLPFCDYKSPDQAMKQGISHRSYDKLPTAHSNPDKDNYKDKSFFNSFKTRL